MSRTAVIAVAAAVVLLGTAQVVTAPPAAAPAAYVIMEDGTRGQLAGWLSAVTAGTVRRPAPLSASLVDLFYAGVSPGTGFQVGPPDGPLFAWDLSEVGDLYTQMVVAPSGQVLAVCEQRVQGWLAPCLLDGVSQVK